MIEAPLVDGKWQMESASWDTMVTRSNIVDASGSNQYKDYAKYYDPSAISNQDLYAAFTDTNTVVPGSGQSIPNHSPSVFTSISKPTPGKNHLPTPS